MASSPSQKKKEETSLKLLRELVSLPHNKQCFECQQRGPTYADMTTCAFLCTQCSGFLRGINPPHRVKSVSMTTFSTDEIQKLRSGGNEIARMIWMGQWDPRRDREPSKKDEQAFREFLRDKYERKKWYRDPAEVKRDIASKSPEAAAVTTPTAKPASLPAPPTQANPRPVIPSSTPPTKPQQQAPPTKPQQQAPPTTSTTKQNEPSLIDVAFNEPVVANPPTGGVSVFPPGAAPLISTSTSVSQPSSTGGSVMDFGAFTSSGTPPTGGLLQPTGSSTGSNSTSQQQPLPSSLSAPAGPVGDRYSALASLDQTLKDIRLQEEEKEQRQQQQQMMQQQQQQQQQLMQQQQQQMMQQQQQMMQQQQQMMQQTGGVANPFGGGVAVLQKKDSNPFIMGGHTPPVTGPRFGAGQVGGAPMGMTQMGMVQMGGAQMGGAQIGMAGGFGQGGMVGYGQQPGMMPQQQFGGFVAAGNQGMMMAGGGAQWQQQSPQPQWGVVPTQGPQQYSIVQVSPQLPQHQPFGGFVAAAVPTTPPIATKQFNWSSSQQTTPTSTAPNMGWSSNLSKPISAPVQPQVSTTPTGWSSTVVSGSPALPATNWGASSHQPTNWGGGFNQQQNQGTANTGWSGMGGGANPFASPTGSQPTAGNPFM